MKLRFVPSVLPGGTPDFSALTEEEHLSPLDSVDCPVGLCGDGVVDPGEECDDGNDERHDDCDEHCRSRVTRRSIDRGDTPSPALAH